MSSSDSESDRSSSPDQDEKHRNLSSELRDAIEQDSTDDVERLLQYDGAVDVRFTYHFKNRKDKSPGTTPLICAAALGKDVILQRLLDHGASLDDMTQENGSTAIHLAAEHNQVGAIDILLKHGASINDLNDFNYTPLIYACWAGNLEAAKLLVSKGANPACIDYKRWNPLSWACRYGHANIVRFLLSLDQIGKVGSTDRKNFLNQQDDEDWPSINMAILNEHYDCVKELLLQPDLEVTIMDNEGDTALSTAARQNAIFIMVQILGKEAYFPDNPVSRSVCLATPSEFGCIERSLMTGVEQAMRNVQEQDRALFWAVANGSLQVVQKCLERQPELIRWSRAGATWLHIAAKYGRCELIKMFVARGLDVCAEADRSTTPLHLAAEGGHRITVKYILEILQGVLGHPARKSGLGDSPCPGLELIRFIMKKNDDGESAITLAGKSRNRGASDILWGEIETFAMTTPSFLEFLPMDPESLSEMAAQFERPGDERILKLLLQHTTKKDRCWRPHNWTALHWAVDSSRPVLVWWLLSNGAHLRSEEIQSALQIVKNKANDGYRVSTVDLLIADLLQNPPMISAHATNEDDYHLPELPTLPDNHREFLEQEGIIVDFYCQDGTVDFRYKRRSLREVIYERGPNAIMESSGRYNCNDLDELKKQIDIAQKVPHLNNYATAGIPRRTTSETITDARDTRKLNGRTEAHLPKYSEVAENELGESSKDSQERRNFRWIHVPAHNMKIIESLITRIVIDSGKTKRQHGPLANLLSQSLIEVAAGGGKRYIKPQFIRRTIGDIPERPKKDQKVQNNDSDDDSSDDDNTSSNNTDEETEDTSSEGSSGTFADDSVALYIPFLTVAEILESTDSSRGKGIQRPTVMSRTMQPMGTDEKDPWKTLHERMTLDQYYYTTVPDSTSRDYDQVLSRYLAWQESEHLHDRLKPSSEKDRESELLPIKVFAVDQLWMWIIDDAATIVTASTSDFEGFVDTVFDALVFEETKGGYPRPHSVRPMMNFILSIVTGPQMQNVPVLGKRKLKQPLEIFRESIRHVAAPKKIALMKAQWQADIETKMSRSFIDSVVGGYTTLLPKRDVGKEYRLLYEIKDIREELTILKTLAEVQAMVWRQAFNTSEGSESEYSQVQSPRQNLLEIKEAAREAESVQDAITTLLDLRQKHAGNQDAEFGRQQANTTMVFTIVTIIFLPLSFLASLFDLNVAEFPHESGDVQYKASWVFPIIFGCAVGVSLPLIIIAFNVNELIMIPFNRLRASSNVRRRSGPFSVRPLTEETMDDSTDRINPISMYSLSGDDG
ncbi:CorA-like Mg2+ transporter protein [Aspergillus sclerotialis]|uniref:CorA-like Mg2+ transporter protein n=1 Tax=Aspergillus sclerotialis TaxID=2070753 RepID=A0A3A2ZTN0_9EURO|nr:CorA-like Mg2+ transporter protein [Aspergillus sclerotialis]